MTSEPRSHKIKTKTPFSLLATPNAGWRATPVHGVRVGDRAPGARRGWVFRRAECMAYLGICGEGHSNDESHGKGGCRCTQFDALAATRRSLSSQTSTTRTTQRFRQLLMRATGLTATAPTAPTSAGPQLPPSGNTRAADQLGPRQRAAMLTRPPLWKLSAAFSPSSRHASSEWADYWGPRVAPVLASSPRRAVRA